MKIGIGTTLWLLGAPAFMSGILLTVWGTAQPTPVMFCIGLVLTGVGLALLMTASGREEEARETQGPEVEYATERTYDFARGQTVWAASGTVGVRASLEDQAELRRRLHEKLQVAVGLTDRPPLVDWVTVRDRHTIRVTATTKTDGAR